MKHTPLLLLLTLLHTPARAVDFDTAVSYPTGNGTPLPYGNVIADFDGVNGLDIAVANYNSASQSVVIFINNGDGTYSNRDDYPLTSGDRPLAIASADFDGIDGPDLVTLNQFGGSVSVFKNNGDGTMAGFVDHPGGGTGHIIAAELDGSNNTDIVTSASNISAHLNDGTGAFPSGSGYGSLSYSGIISGDFDGVNGNDLAAVSSASVDIFLNDGDGTFTQSLTSYTTGNDAHSIAQADFDSDNNIDLVFTNRDDDTVTLLYGNGDGTFTTGASYTTGDRPRFITVTDLDADGFTDLVVTNQTDDSVSVLLNNTTDSRADNFDLRQDYQTGDLPISANTGDLDGDGFPEIVITNNNSGTISVLRNITDKVPDAFSFIDQNVISENTTITSATITIAGINNATDISITGGEYSINGGAYTTADGRVYTGDMIDIRVTSAATTGNTVDATLTIGGVSDTFSVTTVEPAESTGKLTAVLLLILGFSVRLTRRLQRHTDNGPTQP